MLHSQPATAASDDLLVSCLLGISLGLPGLACTLKYHIQLEVQGQVELRHFVSKV